MVFDDHVNVPQKDVSAKVSDDYAERRRRREEELREETVRTDWCYGPQKLNYVELKKVRGATGGGGIAGEVLQPRA